MSLCHRCADSLACSIKRNDSPLLLIHSFNRGQAVNSFSLGYFDGGIASIATGDHYPAIG